MSHSQFKSIFQISDFKGSLHNFLSYSHSTHPDNLLYAPEIKFYSNKLIISNNFETSLKGFFSIGDGGGMTRGLMMASCSGVQIARILAKRF